MADLREHKAARWQETAGSELVGDVQPFHCLHVEPETIALAMYIIRLLRSHSDVFCVLMLSRSIRIWRDQ